MKQIVLASGNSGKLREFRAAFAQLAIEVLPITQFSSSWSVDETGVTFCENARIKAEAAMRYTGLPALADDSGLVVYYLGGAPGVYSQRYSGPDATDASNNALLLAQLEHARWCRYGHFEAVLAYAEPHRTTYATGRLYGSIALSPRGTDGFGYDPIFEVKGHCRTLAELTLQEKNNISHRALALRNLVAQCQALHN